jgi:HEAT repeat protein
MRLRVPIMLPMRRLAWALLLLASCSGPEPNTLSKDPYERYLGVKEIGVAGDVAAEPELLRLLDDPHYLVVTGVLEVMARFGRKEYLPYVLPRLKSGHPMVRAQAIETVAAIAGAEGLDPIASVLASDPDPAVRRPAVKVLAAVYGKNPKARQAFVEALGDKDPSVAYMAYQKLCELTGRNDLPRSKEAWAQAIQP